MMEYKHVNYSEVETDPRNRRIANIAHHEHRHQRCGDHRSYRQIFVHLLMVYHPEFIGWETEYNGITGNIDCRREARPSVAASPRRSAYDVSVRHGPSDFPVAEVSSRGDAPADRLDDKTND